MDVNTTKFALRPLALPAAHIAGLKLMQAAAAVQLVTSTTQQVGHGAETVLSAMPVSPKPGASAPFIKLSQRLPPPPEWDLALDGEARRLAVVHERALGGSYVLGLVGFDKSEASLPAAYDPVSYTRPRFVGRRSDDAVRRITAIADQHEAVWFERSAAGAFERRGVLCECSDAVAVPYRNGFVLVYKQRLPGAVRGDDIAPGTLHWRPLDAQLAPTAAGRELFPGLTVFEFAVDTAGDAFGVLMTTAEGTRLAIATAPAGPWAASAFVESGQGEAFSRPSLVLTPELVHMALLERPAGGTARVWFGTASTVLPK